MKEIIDKMDFIKIEDFCKKHHEENEKTSTEWEKILAKDIFEQTSQQRRNIGGK